MALDEQERMQYLCERIAIEKDPKLFAELVIELNDLLELKHGRIYPEQQDQPELVNELSPAVADVSLVRCSNAHQQIVDALVLFWDRIELLLALATLGGDHRLTHVEVVEVEIAFAQFDILTQRFHGLPRDSISQAYRHTATALANKMFLWNHCGRNARSQRYGGISTLGARKHSFAGGLGQQS
jgi:hypothetical protein